MWIRCNRQIILFHPKVENNPDEFISMCDIPPHRIERHHPPKPFLLNLHTSHTILTIRIFCVTAKLSKHLCQLRNKPHHQANFPSGPKAFYWTCTSHTTPGLTIGWPVVGQLMVRLIQSSLSLNCSPLHLASEPTCQTICGLWLLGGLSFCVSAVDPFLPLNCWSSPERWLITSSACDRASAWRCQTFSRELWLGIIMGRHNF